MLWIQIDLYLLLDESFATLDPLQSLQPDILRYIFHIIDQSFQHCALSRVKLRSELRSCLVLVQLHLKNTLQYGIWYIFVQLCTLLCMCSKDYMYYFNVLNRLFSDCYHANIINSKKEMPAEIIPRFFRKCRALIIVEVYSQANL